LFTELREKLSLAYEVSSFYPTRRQQSRFVVYMGLDAKNLDRAGKRIDELLQELTTTPVTEQELQDTKNYIRGMYLLDRQTVSRQAWYAGWWEIMGPGYAFDERYLDTLMEVSVADIQRVTQTWFSPKNYVKVILFPSK
jgi:predicted Zn-dependent peptidase